MIKERMLEFLCLSDVLSYYIPPEYDREKMLVRYKKLRAEFMHPYVIDPAEKSE